MAEFKSVLRITVCGEVALAAGTGLSNRLELWLVTNIVEEWLGIERRVEQYPPSMARRSISKAALQFRDGVAAQQHIEALATAKKQREMKTAQQQKAPAL